MRVDTDINTPGNQPGSDREAVLLASACAIRERVYALPTLLTCPVQLSFEDSAAGTDNTDQNPPPLGPNPNVCTCAGAVTPVLEPICIVAGGGDDHSCVAAAGALMATLTTFNPLNSAIYVDWQLFSATIITELVDRVEIVTELDVLCDSIDFNNDNLFPADDDLIDFLSVLAGGSCSTGDCNDLDFNNDCLFPSDEDFIAFLTVLAGGSCGG